MRLPAARVVDIAVRYEQLFWLAAGVLVMTGVGNLGAFGIALPEPGTTWGRTFIAKLSLVAMLVLLSVPRSLAVARVAARAPSGDTPLRTVYAGTTTIFAALVGLAVGLAHG